jgi:2-(3-amino-3-carboxypropyl)histidine synthase
VDTVKANFPQGAKLAILGTIQFAPALHALKDALASWLPDAWIPQAKPLSPGEVLGCTSPSLSAHGLEAYIFVADGRFHLESVMIANPGLQAYRYDPYGKRMTREYYDTVAMHAMRQEAIARAAGARRFGLVLGTLGRQGNPAILERLEAKLAAAGKQYFTLLLSELSPAKVRGVR